MPDALLLVHSPLLGPASLAGVAEDARARGLDVAVPDLREFTGALLPRWQTFVDLAVAGSAALGDGVIVVGHSGAGVMLPSIAERLARRLRGVVFTDAVVPPSEGHHRTPAALLEMLDERETDGVLANWFDWWPPEAIAELLPDVAQRTLLAAEAPQLPRAFYDEQVPVPSRWSAGPMAYLQLSPAYEDDCARASEWAWPTARLDGTHLSPVTEPTDVLDAIIALVARL